MADPAARGIRSGLAEAGYTLESGGVRVRQALHEGGFDEDDLVRLDARELRQCHTTWAKRLAHGRDPRAVGLRAMLAGDAKARKEEYSPAVRTRGLKRLLTFETTKQANLRFRVRLTEGASEVEVALV